MPSSAVSTILDDFDLQANSNGMKYFSASFIRINSLVGFDLESIFRSFSVTSHCFFSWALWDFFISLSMSIFSSARIKNVSAGLMPLLFAVLISYFLKEKKNSQNRFLFFF